MDTTRLSPPGSPPPSAPASPTHAAAADMAQADADAYLRRIDRQDWARHRVLPPQVQLQAQPSSPRLQARARTEQWVQLHQQMNHGSVRGVLAGVWATTRSVGRLVTTHLEAIGVLGSELYEYLLRYHRDAVVVIAAVGGAAATAALWAVR